MSDPGDAPAGPTSGTVHRFARDAMGTTCGIVIAGQQPVYAEQAAAAAFEELARLEAELSRFIERSEVAQINAAAAGEPVRVGIAAWECLQLAARVWAETGGAFDVTLGTGMDLLGLDAGERTVTRLGPAVAADLGGIGKGYAVDAMAAVLRDWGVETALVHTGQSTVYVIGSPPGAEDWPVAIRDPENEVQSLGTVRLRERALSGSGVRVRGGHIVDPRQAGRTGDSESPGREGANPVAEHPRASARGSKLISRRGAWAIAPTAAESDALSTAFMVMSPGEVERYCGQHPRVGGMLLGGGENDRLIRFGSWGP